MSDMLMDGVHLKCMADVASKDFNVVICLILY